MTANNTIRQRVQTCTLFFLGFTLGLFTFSQHALAEEWEEITADYFYFDSSSLFVDLQTGYVVVQIADDVYENGNYEYEVYVIDCRGWTSLLVGGWRDDGTFYSHKNWRNDPDYALEDIANNTNGAEVAKRVCAKRDILSRNSLEQVYH